MNVQAIHHSATAFFAVVETGIVAAGPVIAKVTEFSLYYFDVIRQSCFFVQGADEFYRQGIQNHDKLIVKKDHHIHHANIPGTFFSRVQYLIKDAEKHILRGAFFVGSGVFGTIAAVHRLKGVDSSHLQTHLFLSNVANGLFLAANIISLHMCYQQFQEAKKILDTSKKVEEMLSAERSCDSAVLGMLSSIGYIIVGGMYVLGGPTTWALVLGCVATFTSILKAIYDWYYTRKKEAGEAIQGAQPASIPAATPAVAPIAPAAVSLAPTIPGCEHKSS